MSSPYDDIIGLPHHVSVRHPQMPVANRAAQFSPFAALTGYDDAIEETARLTHQRIELAEGAIAALDRKLALLAEQAPTRPEIAITYFKPDEKKKGGAYVTATGALKKVDDIERALFMMDGERIAIADILDIESGLFETLA